MRAKQLDGLVVQNPLQMGYLGVKTMVAPPRGQPVESASTPASRSSRRRTWTTPAIEGAAQPADREVPRRRMSDAGLRVAGIAKRFGATVALDGVDLDVRAGEVHALIGENGAGKSTLMNVLAGAVRADRGDDELDGAPYAPAAPLDARRRGVALIHQELSLCPHLTVAENILLGLEARVAGGSTATRRDARARALLDELPHPEIHPDRTASATCRCRRDRSSRSVARSPRDARVLLMDEPTSSLQGADVERLFALIRRLRGARHRGRSTSATSSRRCARSPIATPCCATDGAWRRGAIAGVDERRSSSRMMVGRPRDGLFPDAASRRAAASRCSTCAISPRRRACTQASFELRRGEILGIAGLVGSGRTELVRALFGLDTAAAGTVELTGVTSPRADAGPADGFARVSGYLSEDRKGEGLALPLLDRRQSLRHAACSARARAWLDLARADGAHARTGSRAARARALGVAGRCARSRAAISRRSRSGGCCIRTPTCCCSTSRRAASTSAARPTCTRSSRDRPRRASAILIVSSYLPELFGLCDRLAVMCRGRLSPARPIAEWTPERVLATAIGEPAA